MPSYADDRLKTAKTLDSIAAAITQTSPKVQNKLTSVLAGKLGALGTAGGIMGLLSFGTASTGAAATTAKGFALGTGASLAIAVALAIREKRINKQDVKQAIQDGYFTAAFGAMVDFVINDKRFF